MATHYQYDFENDKRVEEHEVTYFMYIAAILNLFQIAPLGSNKTCTHITLSRRV